MQLNRMMDVKEAAEYLHCSVALLRLWKREGRGPKVFQKGGLVRYRQQDLNDFIANNLLGGGQGDLFEDEPDAARGKKEDKGRVQ
jgi:hypothetical protein